LLTNAAAEVAYHAPLAEMTVNESLSELFDHLDGQLTAESSHKEYWPVEGDDRLLAIRASPSQIIEGYIAGRLTFLAFAVTRNMTRYVREKLTQDPSLATRKVGKPLLHFAVYHGGFCGRLPMVQLLLDAGADMHKLYSNKASYDEAERDPHTAVQGTRIDDSADVSDYDGTGEPVAAVIREMLSRGADPNSQVKLTNYSEPLIFHIARMDIPCRHEMELFKAFIKAGLDLNRQDQSGVCLLEIISENASCKDFNYDAVSLLFENGTKMTRRMYQRGYIHGNDHAFKPFTDSKYFHRSAVASTYTSIILNHFSFR
jgi:hypothetical protein